MTPEKLFFVLLQLQLSNLGRLWLEFSTREISRGESPDPLQDVRDQVPHHDRRQGRKVQPEEHDFERGLRFGPVGRDDRRLRLSTHVHQRTEDDQAKKVSRRSKNVNCYYIYWHICHVFVCTYLVYYVHND